MTKWLSEHYKTDPIRHVEVVQGVNTLEPYQKEILKAIAQNDRVVISACHDIGKTWTLAKVVLWLGSVYEGAKIITTAPTYLQVRQLLWSEIRAGYRASEQPLGGEMLDVQWRINDDWFAIGMSPKEDAGASDRQGTDSRFQGFHGELVVVIFDEATGVGPKRWMQAEGMLTSGNVKFIAIGNPTTKNCDFARCFQNPVYRKIELSCFDSPNLKSNDIVDRSTLFREVEHIKTLTEDEQLERIKSYKIVQPKLLTLQWVVSMALKWGIDHPLFISKALGQFPDEDENSVAPLSVVQAAQMRDASEDGGRSVGVDPARFGADSTVITVIEGKKQTIRKVLRHADTNEVAGTIVRLLKELPRKTREVVCVDATGLGAGVFDALKQSRAQHHIHGETILREVHFGASCPKDKDKENYANLKAKMFMDLREDLKNDLSILPDSVYLEELPTILYKFDSKGRFVIESKEDYKKRTGLGSPDSSDSLALANYGRKSVRSVGDVTPGMLPDGVNSGMSSTIVGGNFGDRW